MTSTEDQIAKIAQIKVANQAATDANAAQSRNVREGPDGNAGLDLDEEEAQLQAVNEMLDSVTEDAKSTKADQIIGNVKTAREGQAQIGMSETVAGKVRKQKIGHVQTDEKGKSQVGIFPSSRGIFS